MEILGKEIEVGLGVEDTRGTHQTTAEKWLKRVTCTILPRAEHAIDNNQHGVLEDSDNRRVTRKWFDGELSGIIDADAIGYLLFNLYGAVTSSVVTGQVNTHEFTVAQDIQHGSLSIFLKDGSIAQNVLDNGMLSTLEINTSTDDYVRFTANFIASEESANADTPSYDTQYDWVGADVEVKVASTEAGLAGATASKVKTATVKFDQGIIRDHVLGSYYPNDNFNSKMMLEVELTKNYIDETFRDLFTSDTAKYVQIKIEGSQDIGSGNHPTLTLLLNKAMVTAWERTGEADALAEEKVTLKAFYNATDGQASSLTLKNLTAEYDEPISA